MLNTTGSNRLTDAEYDARHDHSVSHYGPFDASQARARAEQAWAQFFANSGWTQEEIAAKEGKSQQWVSYRVRFGEFLDFTTTVVNPGFELAKLTEFKFRGLWEQTETSGRQSEAEQRRRFRQVVEMLEEEASAPKERQKSIRKLLVKRFVDEKWHHAKTIAEDLDVTEEQVNQTLSRAATGSDRLKGVTVERRKYGPSFQYRMFREDKMVSVNELAAKLAPIIEQLQEQGRKNAATVSTPTVASLAAQIKKLLDELRE
jgi:hypothetical protein